MPVFYAFVNMRLPNSNMHFVRYRRVLPQQDTI
ncbi:hypothetical protein SAMN05660772_00660 [Pasteurella testudinis DSM 23072]|uniref:Uncharacterized protein n=1 Tax=Pasteurella testudinis DSM 23072 TaxID=1122938 RepID=A0A1W1URA5_9PAST|nr:hypothetical protein SAMN05660772_00660 [Pasteurella testudinis DSM 23072]SUB51016.1 Uncharacterised protein [Pasteurella testudinis]